MNQYRPIAPKKVLFLITKATYGGAQKYVFDLATHMDASKFEPIVAFGTAGKLSDDLMKAGIKTCVIRSLGRDIALLSDIASFFQIIRCIRNVRPDVLHLNSSKAAALGALAGRLCGIPRIIFTVHGWPFKENRNAIARGLIRFVSWFTVVLSHAVIVVSKTDEAQGKRMRLAGGKIRYVPLGIEPPQFLQREEASAALSIESASPRIVTIAELTPNKGIRYAIEAIALLKKRNVRVSYSIIGGGEERMVLERLAQEKGVADSIKFLGFVPDAVKYLKAFDMFLLPSVKEGMPYVLLEAASAELSLISTTVVDPAFLEMVHETMRVEPGNPALIADAISAALLPDTKRPKQFLSPLSEMLEKTTALY